METLATQQICRYVVLLVLPFFAAAVVAIFIPGVKRAISLYKSPFVRNNLFASLFFTALYVFSIIAGGTKPVNRQPQISSSTSSGNVLRATGVPDASPRIWSIDEINLGYALCATTAVSNSLFSAPADALHVRSWTERGYCCAFRSVKAPPEWGGRLSAGVNGTLTTLRFGAEAYPFDYCTTNIILAPFMSCNGLIKDVGEFWYVTNQHGASRYVWRDMAYLRSATNLFSFAAEIHANGDVSYHYSFPVNPPPSTNDYLISIQNGPVSTNLTSLVQSGYSYRFANIHGLGDGSGDNDKDGISNFDEVMLHHTDPRLPDSDYDGLSDSEEINVYGTDPLNAYSAGGVYHDGIAVKLGNANLFDHPLNSTNTVLEHLFYSGSADGAFSYPRSSDNVAVLKVSCSGSGSGRLIVGDDVVPLVAPERTRSASQTNTLLLAVGKGVKKSIWFSKPDALELAIDSDDLLIGEIHSLAIPRGWIAFPHTEASVPCIHDLKRNRCNVGLVHGEEFPGLAARWAGAGNGVVITNKPPTSADIYGYFSRRQTREIAYTVSHPQQLNLRAATFEQTLRFCPQFTDSPEYGFSDGVSGGDYEYGQNDLSCNCSSGNPCRYCDGEWCHCESWYCTCNENRSPLLGDCADDEMAFTNLTAEALIPLRNVLYLHRANSQVVHLDVPVGETKKCCPCPEHWSNYVAKAFASSKISVKDRKGGDFAVTNVSCDAVISGVSPSCGFSDASVLFVTNAAPYKQFDYTVLGVKIAREEWEIPLERYDALSPRLGFPIEVCTNLFDAVTLVFKSDVLLTNGYVKVSLEDATGDFTVWLPEWLDNRGFWHDCEKLLDSSGTTSYYMSMRKWRSILRRYWEDRELRVKVTSALPGSCKLKIEYIASDGVNMVYDFDEQRITSVNPLLLADFNRDGKIGYEDVEKAIAQKMCYFWYNNDEWKNDDAFDPKLINRVNSADGVVNGRNDLINFLPIVVDIKAFVSQWSSNAVCYRIESDAYALQNAKLLFADIPHTRVGDMPLGNDVDIDSNAIYEAPVCVFGGRVDLPYKLLSLSQEGRSTMLIEFSNVARKSNLYLNIYSQTDGALLFTSSIWLHIGEISKMIGWQNLRGVAGGSDGVPTQLNAADWPIEEHKPGNIVFVHGYNMAEDAEAPLWAQNVFKKLWWAGLNRGFIAVQWLGNEGQTYIPGIGYVSPNYYGNVKNAFATSAALKESMDNIPGPKWFLAHSLGNMLVSAAIQDWAMPHEKYFMLNAAVAMEAYDPVAGITSESHDNMTPAAWVEYSDRVRATHWYELFPQGDGRRLLTWKGRFANVTNVVNFYSTQEEVVNNGDGKDHASGRAFAWYNQEMRKGNWEMMLHVNEGGWGFNEHYDVMTNLWMGNGFETRTCHLPPKEANKLSNESIMQIPFFQDFANSGMYSSSNGVIVAADYLYRAELLAYAIPVESYAVGANPLPELDDVMDTSAVMAGNYNMATLFLSGIDDLPDNGDNKPKEKYRDWQHSTFVQRSYKRTHQLFKSITRLMKEL